jgi:oxalate decarboxylase/phosphoglucose isomerase-like protein (cupin superfamily)
MNNIVKINEAMTWESPEPHRRWMTLIFERDITPTKQMSAGLVTLPVGQEQTKLSYHPEGEEIYFVLQGSARFQLDEDYADVESNTAVYVPPGMGHRAINTGEGELILYWVNSPSVFGPVKGYEQVVEGWKRVR